MIWAVWIFIGMVNLVLLSNITVNVTMAKERVDPLYTTIAGQILLFLVIAWFMIENIPQ